MPTRHRSCTASRARRSSAARWAPPALAAAGGAAASASPGPPSRRHAAPAPASVPFYGAHQAGIATPAQDRLAFAAFDVTTTDRDRVAGAARPWAAAAAQMTRGLPIGAAETAPQAPPVDTGEALGLDAARADRSPSASGRRCSTTGSGCADRRPAALADLPGAARRRAGPRPQRRRPLRAGLRRTTRRSPSTSSATSPGSPAAPRSCAGRSSASAARPRPRPRRPRRAT